MRRLANFRRFSFVILSVLLTVNLWGQAALSGAGTEDDPYKITSVADWNAFAAAVTGGYSYSGKYVKLTNNISISDIAGSQTKVNNYKAFSGTFDGGNHTIEFNNGTAGTPFSQALCAPFRVINGATIKNLHVKGTIVTNQKYAGGLVGYVYGTSNIKNCISNIDITKTGGGDATHGGFVGQQESGTLVFEDCIFEGSLTGSSAKKVAGFIGWRGGTVTYTNCIQAGTINSFSSNTAIYHRGTNGGGTFDHAYYVFVPSHLETYGLQGEVLPSSATAPTDDIYRKYTNNTTNYYVSGVVITDLGATLYSSSDPAVTITPVVKFRCKTLTRGTDYIIKIDGAVVPTETTPTLSTDSDHTVVIEGTGGYVGSQSFDFTVIHGSGTELDPYQIPNSKVWNAFTLSVNEGSNKFNDKFYKLTANITVSEMVGTEDNPFKGTFVGKNGGTTYTLTFNKGTSEVPFDEEYCAPFRFINGATIKDLNVAGAIYSSKNRAAGLIGKSSGTSTVQDVTVSANIIATEKSYCSGFASANNGTLNFTSCIYNGKIVAGSSCAGLCASGSGTTNINTCMFKPAAETSVSGGQNLSRSDKNNITEGYYTYNIGESEQGYQAYASQPANMLSKKMNLMDGNNYYVDGKAEIDGVEDFYTYTGNTIAVTNTVKFFGETIAAANYTVSITHNNVVSTVVNRGDYKLTVSGVNGNNYYGSTYTEFSVVSGPLSGEGTEASPYLITSAADWNVFAERVSYGLGADKYYQLTADIIVSTMIGTSDESFSGVFDGNWHKITFNKGTAENPFNKDYCAPFRYVEDATIQNLTVDGTIISSEKYVGGMVGYYYASESGNIVNCTSSININCTYTTGDCYYGGFVGRIYSGSSGYLRFRNCMFDGSIIDSKATKDAEICSGFVGYVTTPATDYTRDMIYVNCCMNGTISVKGKTANFHRDSRIPTLFHRTYYLIDNTDDEATQGEAAPTSAPANCISKKYDNRYVPAAVILSLETVAGGKAPVMALYGSKLTRGTDFLVSATSNPYAISGVNENGFYGSVTTRIVDNWTDLNAALKNSNAIVDLVADVTAGPSDGALEVNSGSNVTLNMNGHTIDRNLSAPADPGQVFRISKNKTLTINGNGTITGGYNKRTGSEYDGGGIYNMGTLTLNSVYISGNRCLKKDGVEASGRGGGIYSGTGSSLTMNGCYVTSNKAQGGGGGVYGDGASVFVLDDDYFFQNESESKGGGVRVKTADNVTAHITNSNIVWNMVTAPDVEQAAQGGGIYMEYGNLDMENTSVTGNISNLQGSGLYQSKGTITAKNCNFTDNGSYQDNLNSQGAGAYLYSGTFIMDGGLITGNNAYAGTGGIYINTGAKLKLKGNVTIFDNYIYTGMKPLYKNVYIADPSSNGVIEILSGFDSDSKIAVFKNFTSGFDGVFTKNLYTNGGTAANFVTDDAAFSIGPNGDPATEAQFASPKTWSACVNGVDYNKTGDDEPYSYEILKPVSVVTGNVTANTISFSGAGCLYISDGATLTAEFIDNNDPVRLVIEDGAQVITTSENVEATVKKNTVKETWYLISSAIDNPYIEDNTNVITTEVPTSDPSITYDLYRFNEAASLQWENFRAGHSDFTRFTNGRGYLYRHAIILGYTIIMEGTLNVGDRIGGGEEDNTRIVTYPLSFAGDELTGFNLIGNPYSHNIYKNDEYQTYANESDAPAINDADLAVGYYVLNSATDAFEAKIGYNNPIKPLEGILVKTTSAHDLIITNTTKAAASYTPSKKNRGESGYGNITFEIANKEYSDVAYAMFIDGAGLNKIEHMNEDVPMLYVHQDDENYAIATLSEETKAFDLYFEAKTTGKYTLKVEKTGAYSYLHLIDKVAEKDINLLEDNEYSFVGSPADKADRFIVRLELSENAENSVFAYQSGNEIVVSGEGELQVFDVMGRLVMQKHVNGIGTWHAASVQNGVYILRLKDKTQKIVID